MRKNPYTQGTDQWRAWRAGYSACSADWREAVDAVTAVKKDRWRSSVTGRFVAKLFGRANPRETQQERA